MAQEVEHETLPARRKDIFRDILAAILAVPVIAFTSVSSWSHRYRTVRLALAIVALVAFGGAASIGLTALAGEPSTPPVAVASPSAADPSANVALAGFLASPAAAQPSAPAALAQFPSFEPVATSGDLVAPVAAPVVAAAAKPRPVTPKVVRFRPRDHSTGIAPNVEVSVRFTVPMNRAATVKAFAVQVNGKVVTGKKTWVEGGKVLILTPSKPFPIGAKVTMSVSVGARSAAGARLAKRVIATFTVTKTAPKTTATSTTKITVPSTTSTWHSAELYMLELLNCTRTGGWVSSSGSCTGAGTRNVAPLKLDAGISDKVSRPYAKILATTYQCSHYADGTPHQRLMRAGYANWDWAENVGCPEINPIAGMLAVQLFFQSEKPWNGGHYKNLMNSVYDRCGIGVWVANGHVRVVIDFYHP